MVPSSSSAVARYPNLFDISAIPKKCPLNSTLLDIVEQTTNHFIKNIDKFLQFNSSTVVVIKVPDELIYLWRGILEAKTSQDMVHLLYHDYNVSINSTNSHLHLLVFTGIPPSHHTTRP